MAWFRIIVCSLASILLAKLAFGFAPLNGNLLSGAALFGLPMWGLCGLLSVGLAVSGASLLVSQIRSRSQERHPGRATNGVA